MCCGLSSQELRRRPRLRACRNSENEQAVILGELSFLKGKRLAFTEDQILFALMKHLEPYPGESGAGLPSENHL